MIKGLSEIRRIPRLGKIHLGEKKTAEKSGNLYPSATDYFVVHEDANTSKEMAEKFHKAYGDHPKELNIVFPLDDPEKFFPQWLKRYSKSMLLCKGDGEKAVEVDVKTGERKEITCLYKNCPYYQKKQCRKIGNLQFYLKEIPGGVWQIDTSSSNSIIELNSEIDLIRAQNDGHIAGIPLKLSLHPVQVIVSGYPKTIYVLKLSQSEHNKELEEPDNLLPDSDDLPEDLFPFDISNEPEDLPDFEPIENIENPFAETTTGTKYGQLKVVAVKTLRKNGTNEMFHFLSCINNKGEKYTLMSDDEAVKQLEGKTLIEYHLEPTDNHFEKLVSYKVLENVQKA
jgi:hypothetical protein